MSITVPPNSHGHLGKQIAQNMHLRIDEDDEFADTSEEEDVQDTAYIFVIELKAQSEQAAIQQLVRNNIQIIK